MNPAKPLILFLLLALTGCSGLSSTQPGPQQAETKAAIRAAKQVLGTPYVYGGEDPDTGFDCSGLMVYSYAHAGVRLPRTALLQFKHLRPIRARYMRPGDLLFFRKNRSRVSHVGLYIGDMRFIHAPSRGRTVTIARLDNPVWKKRFVRAGRVKKKFYF